MDHPSRNTRARLASRLPALASGRVPHYSLRQQPGEGGGLAGGPGLPGEGDAGRGLLSGVALVSGTEVVAGSTGVALVSGAEVVTGSTGATVVGSAVLTGGAGVAGGVLPPGSVGLTPGVLPRYLQCMDQVLLGVMHELESSNLQNTWS